MMRARGALLAALLLVATSVTLQVSAGEDLYWEGDEDGSNEFLEVKEEEPSIAGHLRRLKRGFFDFFDTLSSTTTTEAPKTESSNYDDDIPNGREDDSDNDIGSGLEEPEQELGEKTLRVTFVVNQPYMAEYNKRDSPQFKTFSTSLSKAVTQLFEQLPGTQKASLVRIQSRISDEFTCKVTLDIMTLRYDDTDRISSILHDHIRNKRALGSVAVSDIDYSANVIDPGSAIDGCAADELNCADGSCTRGEVCNGYTECADGSDEANCPSNPDTYSGLDPEQVTEYDPGVDAKPVSNPSVPDPSSWNSENGFGESDSNRNNDGFWNATSPPPLPETTPFSCREDELRCDETRCVSLAARCDDIPDCYDGADEKNCEERCNDDDFRCNNGKCIESYRRCDGNVDCTFSEDEKNCSCSDQEFTCVSDRSCIELRKRCDDIPHCPDNSDEADCACSSDQWQCDHGSCIKRSKRCDGRVDCPTDRSDERYCFANGYFRCRSGKLISENQRCDHRYDCPPGDYSDEQNCPCGVADFKCDNGYCIPAYKRCDRTHDCQDRSDERDCTYGTVCMAFEYKCASGMCVRAEAQCNGTVECDDGSDESNCPCKRDAFHCRDGTCINIALRCNGQKDCRNGQDELNCPAEIRCPNDYWKCRDGPCIEFRKYCDGYNDCPDWSDEFDCYQPTTLIRGCPEDTFTCNPGSSIKCARRCDDNPECDNGEDEENCEDCSHECDGICLDSSEVCNGIKDCRDGSDEQECANCDGPNDFRCDDGFCLNANQRCNGVAECRDFSDEVGCKSTVTSAPQCLEQQFTCRDGTCVNSAFVCDGHQDCIDNSDEENCRCRSDEFQCRSGQCIPLNERCDDISQCRDGSDERDCIFTTTQRPPVPPPTQAPPVPCKRNQWRCENGPCIDSFRRCDGHIDCPRDQSDEFDCPPGSPVALNLKTYPDSQSVRHGGDVVFRCRDEGPQRARVQWVREGGRPIKPGSNNTRGRLEMSKVSPADSGVYICQASEYLGYPGSELRVQLSVENTSTSTPQPPSPCQAYQATCGNGQCIPKTAVCDGNRDCRDGSDEENCNIYGRCEPNQFQCANRKCVLKTWLCDFENDCGDNSDEANCGTARPGECLPVEFKCGSGSQCIPKAFHCDHQSDCFDGSDEIGCAPVHVTRPPTPSNVRLNPGETLTLRCEAVGIPIPLISWRLNWGHVPENCTSTSNDGIGVLTCHNMQPEHSGAYSCEAINNKATTFASPDAIVQVNRTDVCPNGYFNSEARSENECIRCFCFGESTQCHSADLFTYNMPTPLGEGGTRLVGVKTSYNGPIQIDPQPITDNYYYTPLRNGATVTRVQTYRPRSYNNAHPYLTLPETYNGNQLTSYGGYIRYQLTPHSPRPGGADGLPDIIIKGKYESLSHVHRGDKSRQTYVEARLTPEHWQKAGRPATREDIMMALDNVEMILLRADLNNAGVNITDFVMESAQHINVGLGAASLVEECTCPPGYEGLSCQKCAFGYVRDKSGPWIGNCVPEQPTCPPGTYGDPNSGYACRPCPCPLTNPQNNFARTCSIGPAGRVICDCAPGYGGETCEYCEPGFVGNPLVPGDSCRPQPTSNCNPAGTLTRLPMDECQCKENVQGRYCDQCKNDSFYLSADFRQGCALCFCSGVSQLCKSSNYRRKTTTVHFNTPQLVQQVRVYNSQPLGAADTVKYNAPKETDLTPTLIRGQIALEDYDRSQPTIYYWSLPPSFAGDKVTAYGGYLTYTLSNVRQSGPSSRNNAADVQLISKNSLTFQYFSNVAPSSDGALNASVQFLEKGWQRADGKEISREHFLLALADVKAILIKATYSSYAELASLERASIDTAEPNGNGPQALLVEQCDCPAGHIGTSCEDCAPGYTRTSSGLYLEHCGPCDCNGHSTSCHPETGVCYDCRDNTAGENCEECKPGYEKNSQGDCTPSFDVTTPGAGCRCDPRGEAGPCDYRGVCQCKQNVEGDSCDVCRPGTFGLDQNDPLGCLPCYCSGVTSNCHEAGHYTRIELPAPVFGDKYGGYTLTNLNADRVINDQFIPDPNASELQYAFNFPPDEELYWSLPNFSGNRVLSYGGVLSLTQRFESNSYDQQVSSQGYDVVLVGDDISVFWRNPTPIRSGEALSYQVPLREQGWYIMNTLVPAGRSDFMSVLKSLRRVLVRATLVRDLSSTAIADVSMDTAVENTDPNAPAAKGVELCMCPTGYSGTSCESCAPNWYKDRNNSCQQCPCNGHDCSVTAYDEIVCNCRPPYSGPDCSTVDGSSSVSNATVRPPPPESTVVVRITSPTIKIEEVGSTVNFTCQARSQVSPNRLPVQWTKADGELPQGRYQIDSWTGTLLITNLQLSDSGTYICQTSDGISTGQAIATLKVPGNQMTAPLVVLRPSSSEYHEGDRIELECLATGNPMPRISWRRSGNYPLSRSAQQLETRFIIESASESDSGEYRCTATNAAGSEDRIAIVKVRARPSQVPRDRLTVSPTAPNINEGQTIRIVCTGTPNIPAGSIDWVREDREDFRANVRADNGVLYVEYARPDNQGVYTCQASSPDIAPVSVLLTVIPLGTPSPANQPNIQLSTKNLVLNTGESGSVDCIPLGYPQPQIRWKKYDGDFGYGVSQRDNSLIISSAQESDEGYYVCEGTVDGTPIANEYINVRVTRREPPRVEIYPQGEQAAPLGSQFDFHCRILGGVPDPDITWSRSGGRPLSPHVQILKNNILRFEKIEVNDEGEYQCVARNEAGTNTASAVLKVRSPPEIVITPSNNVQVQYGAPLIIECRASGYPEPDVSISRNDDRRELVRPTPGIASLNIASVSDRDEGEYVCTATSVAGTRDDHFVIRLAERGDGGDFEGGSGEGEFYPEPQNPESNITPPLITYEGHDRRITCDVPEGYDAQWRRVDRPLQANANQIGTDLIIRSASKSDSGQYECTVIDRYTNEGRQAAIISLEVVKAPRITLEPKTQTVHPGESPTVHCIVEGDDVFDVSWRGNNGRAMPRRVEVRDRSLIFHQIEVEDAGQYECIARSRYGNASAVAEVIVTEESDRLPSESHANEQYAHVGAAVHLSCNVTQPDLRIRWTKDNRNVPRAKMNADGSIFIKLAQKSDSGHYVCIIRDRYGRETSNYINLHIEGPRMETPSLVTIYQPHRQFRVGENVEVDCRGNQRGVKVNWERYDNEQRQYVETRRYADGAILLVPGVQEMDAGVYRCTGQDPYQRTSYEDFNLEVIPVNIGPSRPVGDQEVVHTARLGDSVDMPCNHDLEEPVVVEWRREYTPLSPEVRTDGTFIHLDRVTEADAGTYVCRVSNSRAAVEARALLRVQGVVPRFDGRGWLSLPAIKEPYQQVDIEISFNPSDANGLILYNSKNPDRSEDYVALQLVDGVPEFTFDPSSGPTTVRGDRPLQLNTWHTIRIHRIKAKVTMDVDNTGPFVAESPAQWDVLELNQPLYIGGVPDYTQLPYTLSRATGFVGCVSMLILGREEKNIMVDSIDRYNVQDCDTCSPNLCQNNGVCQEARNERGYMCLCAAGFAGINCDRTGEACRPGICGPGKCQPTADGYKCACPVTYTGRNCDVRQQIEYPAFTGSAYLAIKPPETSRLFQLSMKIKATAPVTDGIIMYCAENARGYGGFTSLGVRDGKLEFRYDLGDGSAPVILTANSSLPANEWKNVTIARLGDTVSLKIFVEHRNAFEIYEQKLKAPRKQMILDTPMFVGGVDDSIALNANTGITGGFNGCIKDVMRYGTSVDIVNSSILSANVQECSNYDRGDIPEIPSPCSQCRNGGYCSEDGMSCTCPESFTGVYCEKRVPLPARRPQTPGDPCAANPCRNNGVCRSDRSSRMRYSCDCPLHFGGTNCQMPLALYERVGFNGNGYLELPSELLRYDRLDSEPVLIALAFHTTSDGVLLYQREAISAANYGDYILLRVEQGHVMLEWDFGSGLSRLVVEEVSVNDGERHNVIVQLNSDNSVMLNVDRLEKNGMTNGFTNLINADSNIYIGGIPDQYNLQRFPGLTGCIDQVELMNDGRSVNLGKTAVAGWNAQRCRDSRY